jgi:hypothetical protein
VSFVSSLAADQNFKPEQFNSVSPSAPLKLLLGFPSGGLDFSRLGPKSIRDFFATQCQGYQPGSTQVVASSVRSYLRFRALRHADPVEALLAAIPQAARWPLVSCPIGS